jgi:hypothetical protein
MPDRLPTYRRGWTAGENYRFAVAGNINNSIGIFERKIVPALNESGVDFVISAGNAMRSGGEDKHRALAGTLGHLQIPYLLTFGENEAANFGAFRFYNRFGPYFFGFNAGNARFIFLDSTGETSFSWQLHWLEQELEAAADRHVFIFLGHPVFHTAHETPFDSPQRYIQDSGFRQGLISLADRYGVKRVLIAGLLVQALAAGAFIFASRLGEFYAVAAVFGFAYGGVMPLYAVLAREYFGQRILGAVFGAAAMVSSLGMALGPALGGWIFDTFGRYTWMYVGSAAIGLGAVAIALAFPPFPKSVPLKLKEVAT